MADNLDEILRRAADTKVPRRSFLAAAGLLGGSAALAACSTGTGGATPAPAASGSGAPAASGPAASAPPAGDDEEQLAKLQAGATGYDVAAPTAEYVPSMVEGGYIQKLDWSRIPNQKYIDP